MSAAEIIEQIKGLTAEERSEVIAFLRAEEGGAAGEATVQYIPNQQTEKAADEIEPRPHRDGGSFT